MDKYFIINIGSWMAEKT